MENQMLARELRKISRSTDSAYKKQIFRQAARRIEEQAKLLDRAKSLLLTLEKRLPNLDTGCEFCDQGAVMRQCVEKDELILCDECKYDCFCKDCLDGSKWKNSALRDVVGSAKKRIITGQSGG